MAKFFVVAGEENCAICEGRGYVTMPPSQGGDVMCPICQGSGMRERSFVALEDSLQSWGVLDRLDALESGASGAKPPTNCAADAMADMRRMVMSADAPVQEVSCSALVAIAEQLAVISAALTAAR